jgi:uncharacterized protein (DUF2267 family)
MQDELREFWDEIRARWTPGDEDELRRVTRRVLLHLRRRLPHAEGTQLFAQLPDEVARLSHEPEHHAAEVRPQHARERVDAPEFDELVALDAGVPVEAAARAVEAVFAALKHYLPPDEAANVREMLPRTLKQRWLFAA